MSGGVTIGRLLPWVGVIVLLLGAASTSGVALWRIDAMSKEIADQGEGIDDLEDEVDALDRLLLQRQGTVDLRTQRIELEQSQQGDKLDEILVLLKRQPARTE